MKIRILTKIMLVLFLILFNYFSLLLICKLRTFMHLRV